MRICDLDECERPHRAKGLCALHYRHQFGRQETPRRFSCGGCGADVSKVARADRVQRFCSEICKSVANGGRLSCQIPDTHPARWIGEVLPVFYGECLRCGALTVSSPWNPKRYCSKRCSTRAKSSREGRRTGWARQARNEKARKLRSREVIFDRDGYVCWLCHTLTQPASYYLHPLHPTVDHVIPQAHGGDHSPSNLRTAHRICNSRRQDRVEVTSLPIPLEV